MKHDVWMIGGRWNVNVVPTSRFDAIPGDGDVDKGGAGWCEDRRVVRRVLVDQVHIKKVESCFDDSALLVGVWTSPESVCCVGINSKSSHGATRPKRLQQRNK